jgi:hypothetical protein
MIMCKMNAAVLAKYCMEHWKASMHDSKHSKALNAGF